MAESFRENLTRRKRLIWLIIFLLLLLIIAALIYLYLFFTKPTQPVQPNVNAIPTSPVDFGANQPDSFNDPSGEILSELEGLNEVNEATEEEQAEILFIANAFAERFGSYSNQSEFANLDDLEIFMTDSMYNWIKTYKEDLTNRYGFDTYYAVETKVISNRIENIDDNLGTGSIMLKTQRQEFNNDIANPKVFYQDIKLNIVKLDGNWKVDGAYWQPY